MTEPMIPGIDYPGINITYYCHDGTGRYVFNLRGKNCRDEQGKWDCGAGKLELHQTIEECLRKEIKEEYCTDVLDYEFLGFDDVHREHNGVQTHWIGLRYRVRVDAKKVANGEPHKFDDVQWFTLDNLPSPLHSQVEDELRAYRDKLT